MADPVKIIRSFPVAPGLFQMTLESEKISSSARPGQFVHILCSAKVPDFWQAPSDPLLRRPFSIAGANQRNGYFDIIYQIRGLGTRYLAERKPGDLLDVMGPLGNGFTIDGVSGPVLLVAGGTGVAPLLFLAEELSRRGIWGTAVIGARTGSLLLGSNKLETLGFKAIAVTEDGSEGETGRATDVVARLIKRPWKHVFACGPLPMIAALNPLMMAGSFPCQVSLEERMACGIGACRGCTCFTKHGPRRVCKDGPVFQLQDLIDVGGQSFQQDFADAGDNHGRNASRSEACRPPDLRVRLGPIILKNPVMVSSGAFGFGEEYAETFDISELGAIVTKGITLDPKAGNPPPRVMETPSGMLNSIGLENPGLDGFVRDHLPFLARTGVPVIVNLAGETYDDFSIMLDRLDAEPSVTGFELNVSCPNVAAGGLAFGRDPESVYHLTRLARRRTSKLLIVKLSPNVSDIAGIARAAEMGGADGISLVNTFIGTSVDIDRQSFSLANKTGGLSGPAIRPLAVKMVGDVFNSVKIPIIGMGGIVCGKDAIEFMLAGATAVSVGTGLFVAPGCAVDIVRGIQEYMLSKGFASINDMVGFVWRKERRQG